MVFEPNRGQTDGAVDYLARGEGYTLFLTGGDAVFDLTRTPGSGVDEQPAGRAEATDSGTGSPPVGAVVRMRLVGAATDPSGSGISELAGASNYLRGDDPAQWQIGVPHYAAVRYDDVYPGVDAVYRSDAEHQLEYDFHVAPGADPAAVTLGFDGIEDLHLGDDGALLVDTAVGTLRQQAPVAYQPTPDGGRRQVAARFVRRGEDQVGFELGVHDPEAPLVIDPVVVYSTFVGGQRSDAAVDLAADDAGNAYVTGVTESASFRTTTGAYDETCGTGEEGCGDTTDAFVTKLDTNPEEDGPAVVYSTYLGGTGNDQPTGIAIDEGGAAYLTGTTFSTDFPTPNGFDDTCGACGKTDPFDNPLGAAFVAKLTPGGSDLAYGTYLGGGGGENGRDIAADPAGHAYVTGDTRSGDFPTTEGAYDRDCGTDGDGECESRNGRHVTDAFATKLAADGSGLAYSSYLGGSKRDRGRGIAVNDGHAYVTGDTVGGFPTTEHAFQTGCASCAFATKLASDGSALDYSTYLGGGSLDFGRDVAVDQSGHAYVTGDSTSDDFPTTERGFESGCRADTCAFVTKLEPGGGGQGYSALFGTAPNRDGKASGRSIAVDDANRAHVAGLTQAPSFPVTDDAYSRSCDGCGDAAGGDGFLTVLPRDGSAPEYSTFLGGSHLHDLALGVAVDQAGDVYVAGETRSADFPTMDATQASFGGRLDGFVVKLTRQPQRPIVYAIDQHTGPTAGGTEVTITGRGLGDVSEVRFGDQPVAAEDFTVESDTEITATAPPVGPPATKPDTRMVTVTDDRGTSPPTSQARFSTYQGSWRPAPDLASRVGHTATRLNDGRVLLAGGTSGDESVQTYNPDPESATVTNAASMGTTRSRHSATRLDGPDCDGDDPPEWCGDVLVAGGWTPGRETLASAEVYDPEAETWTVTSEPMDTVRRQHTATRLPDGRVLVAGGSGPDGELDSVEIYNPATREWDSAASLHNRRRGHTATALDDGRVLVVGGAADHVVQTDEGEVSVPRIPPAEIYHSADDRWTDLSEERDEPPDPALLRHFNHTAVTLGNGQVLIAGGNPFLVGGSEPSNVSTSLAQLFDAQENVWRGAASMHNTHNGHAATRLADGRVLVAGGHSRYRVSDAETYEPGGGGRDDAWYHSAPMLAGRSGVHTATLLSASTEGFVADPTVCGDQCGQVLVVGGSDNPPAELYTPAPSVSGMQPTAGEEGTEVTVTGAGFDDETEVLFGQTPAQEVHVDSFGQLTAVAPAGAGPTQVTVRNPQGLDAAPQRFSYPGGGGGGGGGGATDDTTDTAGQDDTVDDDSDDTPEQTEPAEVPSDDPERPPGRVDDLTAKAQSGTEVELSFSAVGADGDGQPPPAGDYIVKQSTEPIETDAAFDEAFTLCGEACSFGPAAVGDPLSLTVTDLEPDTTYHYAVKARDPAGNLDERSNVASATTTTADAGGGPASACDSEAVPASGFDDIAGSVHESAIDCLAWYAITLGVGDIDDDRVAEYAPRQPITRAQMATFLSRVAAEAGLSLPTDAPDAFGDDDGSIHAPRIDALAALGITKGKGDLDGDGRPDFAPGEPVARDQMASFLTRLHQRVTGTLPEAGEDRFGDDDGSVHEPAINALAALGVTQGKGDLDGDGMAEYAPREPVSRAQMASFLARELEQLVEAGAVHPGGAEVLLDDTEAAAGETLFGRVRSHRQVTGLVADGCGVDGESVALNEQRAFTLAVPSGQPAGTCELTLTATVQPVDPAAEGQQRVTYHFDVTVGE